MTSRRTDGAHGRLAPRMAAAALFALLSVSGALAEKSASAPRAGDDAKNPANSTRETTHPAPPTAGSDAGAPHHFGPRPDMRDARGDKGDRTHKGDNPREGNNDRGARSGLRRGTKPVAPSLDKLDVSVPRLLPKGNARDRLFRKIEAVKLAPIHHQRPAGPISPTGPARNAIGVIPVDVHSGATHLAAIPVNPGRGPIGLPNPPRNWVRVPPVPAAVPTPPHGLINGTTVQHVGSGPGTLGGPARLATGINGTTFKPKH